MGVSFTTVDPSAVPAASAGRRSRKSGPILDAFIDSGAIVVKIDADTIELAEGQTKDKALNSLYSSLGSYAVNNELPVAVTRAQGDVYLRRMDLDDEGNERSWTPKPKPVKKAKAEDNGDDSADVENPEEYE